MKTTIHQAILAHQEGRFEEAEQFYKTILESQPEHLDALNNLGALLLQNNRFEEAEEYCKKAIELKPDFAEAYNNLGLTFQKLNSDKESEINFKKAIELKPDFVEAYSNLGKNFQKLEKLDLSEINYKKALELRPNYTEVCINLSVLFLNNGRLKDAERYCKKAIEINPDFAEVYNILGLIFQKLDRNIEAEVNFKKAIDLKPNFAQAYNRIAATQKKLGKLKLAEKNLNKSKKLRVDNDKKKLLAEYQKAKDYCDNILKIRLSETPKESAFAYNEMSHRGFFIKNNLEQVENFTKQLPMLTWSFLDFIKTLDLKDAILHELGSGNSTIWFSNIFRHVESYETNKDWYDQLKPRLKNNVSLKLTELENIYKCLIQFKTKDWLLIDFSGKRTKFIHKLVNLPDDKIPAQIILDNSEVYRNGAKILIDRGYIEIPFFGFKSGETVIGCTSLFILKNYFEINALSKFYYPRFSKIVKKNIWDEID